MGVSEREVFALVCPSCDALVADVPAGGGGCTVCGAALGGESNVAPAPSPEPPAAVTSGTAGPDPGDSAGRPKEEQPMDIARHHVCPSCYTPVPLGDKFCGRCGTASPFEKGEMPVEHYSATQVPGKARLFLLKGQDTEWVSYHLNSKQHVLGRTQGVIIVDADNWTSPRHATFYYDDSGQLYVRDDGSLNGVYLRVRAPVEVPLGTTFYAGEHLFRVDPPGAANDVPSADGTYFFHGIWQGGDLRVVELLEGGEVGLAVHGKNGVATVGREDCDLIFQQDAHMDLRHVQVEPTPGGFRITDLGSKNGTYVRIGGDTPLGHGDYILIGRQILRVEVTP